MANVTGQQACIDALNILVNGFQLKAQKAGEEIAALLKAYAKDNHLWQNQTGLTEDTTDAQVIESTAEQIVIALFTGTPYSVFLELSRNGKYAWLFPAILANEQQIMSIVQSNLQQG